MSIGNIVKKIMNMKFRVFCCLVLPLFASGCFSAGGWNRKALHPASEGWSSYRGQKARIAVSDFELNTSGLTTELGQALKEYFVSILAGTNHFILVAPTETDLIISAGVVEFVPENSGGKSGVGGGGSAASNFMGGLLGTPLNKATMQLNLRIVDRPTSSVISSRDIQSQAVENPENKINTPRDKAFKSGLSEYAGTPMGKVIHECLLEAARYTVSNVPQNYYKD
ncbi:MAG: CsgG/HfaB family protein [Candidatus Omnitrophota bacterium]